MKFQQPTKFSESRVSTKEVIENLNISTQNLKYSTSTTEAWKISNFSSHKLQDRQFSQQQ